MKIRNIFIIFIVSGFWHGANWTFIIWGALNAIYFLPLMLLNKNRVNTDIVAQGKWFPSLKEFLSMFVTFSLTVFAWIFFRAENLNHAWSYLSTIFSITLFSIPNFVGMKHAFITVFLIMIFVLIEWIGREDEYAIERISFKWGKPYRWLMYNGIILAILWFSGHQQQFIYFQF